MSIKNVLLCLLVFCCGSASVASAAVIVDADGAGTVVRSGSGGFGSPPSFSYSFSSDEIRVGSQLIISGVFGRVSSTFYHSYYVFDLATIDFPVTQATLALQLAPTAGAEGLMTVFALETVTAEQLSSLSSASSQSMLEQAFADIGSGAAYGSGSVASAGLYSFDLADSALVGINASSGLFALGLSVALTDGEPLQFNGFNLGDASLSLTGAPPPQTVPLPGTLGLLAFGGVLLLRQRRHGGRSL